MNSVRSVLAIRGFLARLDGVLCSAAMSRTWHSSATLELRGRGRISMIRSSAPNSRTEIGQVEGDSMIVGRGRGNTETFSQVLDDEEKIGQVRGDRIKSQVGGYSKNFTERSSLVINQVISAERKVGQVRDDRTSSQGGGYTYFKELAEHASEVTETQKSGQNLSPQSTKTDLEVTENVLSRLTKSKMIETSLKSDATVKPALPRKSFNLATYVAESETLTNLVKLGVDLTKIELDAETSNRLVKLDFEKDVQPYLAFLHQNGVRDADVGVCITRNPKIFLIPLDHLETRLNYLRSKKFTDESIGRILSKFPQLFSLTTKQIDGRLGFLQREFKLSGDEVRLVVTRFPKITLWDQRSIKTMKMTYKDFLGFAEPELKQLLVSEPKLYSAGKHAIMKRFEYIHKVIGFSHEAILTSPSVLRVRLTTIKPRHLFLKHLGRDQFDPKKENFVSLKSLALGRDVEFCENFAKVSVQEFNDFLKTL